MSNSQEDKLKKEATLCLTFPAALIFSEYFPKLEASPGKKATFAVIYVNISSLMNQRCKCWSYVPCRKPTSHCRSESSSKKGESIRLTSDLNFARRLWEICCTPSENSNTEVP